MEKVPLNSGGKSEYGLIETDIRVKNNSNPVSPKGFLPTKFWTRVIPAVGLVTLVCVVAFVFFRSSGETLTPIEENLQATAELETGAYIDLEAKQGRIRGYVRNTRQGRNYLAFYKIPFAQPPVGSLRFQEPQPAGSWEGLRDVNEVAPQCLQRIKYSPVVEAGGEEDCLNLNLYTPSVQNKSAFQLWCFTDGNGSRYGAEYFLDEDVVLITIHYRLAAFGFLNSEDGVFPGNVGFKDQLMSLRWVKNNVAEYGGDPERSGASVCNTLDLFSDNPLQRLREVAEELNCPSNGTTAEIMECFMSKPPSEIAIARPSTENGHFAASIDTNSPSVFMPDSPYKILKDKKANSVPYILGIVTAEWLFDALAALHDPELYQFPYYGYLEIPFGDPEYYNFSEYFVKLWAQFAATGNPSGMNGLEWQSSPSREGAFWFELNDSPGRTHILDERMQFWDQFTDSQLKLE
ncbi:Venom carboxylesterase-6 [Orchesella cincta]|uniref:Venom carboxylesterase-6 n=1 Tax=Orchesella cincta TaxID=48709 RepID=A0A1D2MPS7_ORCCI|nr:Venom carboxylesterase-6 [Orchesella cincta]